MFSLCSLFEIPNHHGLLFLFTQIRQGIDIMTYWNFNLHFQIKHWSIAVLHKPLMHAEKMCYECCYKWYCNIHEGAISGFINLLWMYYIYSLQVNCYLLRNHHNVNMRLLGISMSSRGNGILANRHINADDPWFATLGWKKTDLVERKSLAHRSVPPLQD